MNFWQPLYYQQAKKIYISRKWLLRHRFYLKLPMIYLPYSVNYRINYGGMPQILPNYGIIGTLLNFHHLWKFLALITSRPIAINRLRRLITNPFI